MVCGKKLSFKLSIHSISISYENYLVSRARTSHPIIDICQLHHIRYEPTPIHPPDTTDRQKVQQRKRKVKAQDSKASSRMATAEQANRDQTQPKPTQPATSSQPGSTKLNPRGGDTYLRDPTKPNPPKDKIPRYHSNRAVPAILLDILPPRYVQLLNNFFLHPNSPFQSLYRSLAASLSGVWPVLALAGDRLAQAALNSPDAVLLVVLLALLLIAIQIWNLMRRIMYSLMKMVFNLMFYAVLAVLAAFMWQRGLTACVRDTIVWGGRLWGYADGVKNVFLTEYERYVEEERLSRGQPRV